MSTFFVIRHKTDGTFWSPPGVSTTPQLFATRGKAEGRRKQLWHPDDREVVEATLTLKENNHGNLSI